MDFTGIDREGRNLLVEIGVLDSTNFRAGRTPCWVYNPAMKFIITLDRDEDGVWIAECPSIPGCISQGANRDEAETNIREAIVACLEVRAEQGMPLSVETRTLEVAFA